jgi:hypothetical protein
MSVDADLADVGPKKPPPGVVAAPSPRGLRIVRGLIAANLIVTAFGVGPQAYVNMDYLWNHHMNWGYDTEGSAVLALLVGLILGPATFVAAKVTGLRGSALWRVVIALAAIGFTQFSAAMPAFQ